MGYLPHYWHFRIKKNMMHMIPLTLPGVAPSCAVSIFFISHLRSECSSLIWKQKKTFSQLQWNNNYQYNVKTVDINVYTYQFNFTPSI